jgi:hypothetical protein
MTPVRSCEPALFAVGIALLLTLRWLLVPADDGQIGPYRASAVATDQPSPRVSM